MLQSAKNLKRGLNEEREGLCVCMFECVCVRERERDTADVCYANKKTDRENVCV